MAIDLRSDTVTQPSQGMREAIASAPVETDATAKAGKVRRVAVVRSVDDKAAKPVVRKVVAAAADAGDEADAVKKKAAKPKAAATGAKRGPKAKAKGKEADLDDTDLSDIDDELEGEPETAETVETTVVATTEKVKPPEIFPRLRPRSAPSRPAIPTGKSNGFLARKL